MGGTDEAVHWFCSHCQTLGRGEAWPHEVAYGHETVPLTHEEFLAVVALAMKDAA